ncbi:MAG: XRE family transcriptional regulator [Bacteroidetes bacterium]|nr:MAG: XRE family transcriptional regulator [Bacteroidota bacterium]
MKPKFGEFIRKLRVEKGFTLTQLAAKLNMDSANLSKIETGKRDFDEKRIPKLAAIFDLDAGELRDELLSEKIANKLYEYNCPEKVLNLAEEKVRYLRQVNSKQGKLHL